MLNLISKDEQRVLVSKDSDFYYTHLLQGLPPKLVIVRTGNLRTRELTSLFERHLSEIIRCLENHSLVELNRTQVSVHG